MATIDDFKQLDIRVGKVIAVDEFPEARTPAYKLTIDFGEEIGVKRSSVQVVETYQKDALLGVLVVGVVNFPPRQVGPFMSEVLTLGFRNSTDDGYVLITPSLETVNLGAKLC